MVNGRLFLYSREQHQLLPGADYETVMDTLPEVADCPGICQLNASMEGDGVRVGCYPRFCSDISAAFEQETICSSAIQKLRDRLKDSKADNA